MEIKWQVRMEKIKYQLNLCSYSSLFVNSTTNESILLNPVIEYFQPRSKMKERVTIEDLTNELEEITYSSFTAFKLSHQILKEETTLNAKSLVKSRFKSELLNFIETDGYMLTVNTLLGDLLQDVNVGLPVRVKNFNVDSFIRLLEIDFSTPKNINRTSKIFERNEMMLQVIVHHLKVIYKNSALIFFLFPECHLSPREQLLMKDVLIKLSKEIPIFTITSSRHFIANELSGINYLFHGKQLFTEGLLDDLEWESPLQYKRNDLERSIMDVTKNHLDMFESIPVISNYKQADIIIFNTIDLYVLVFILSKLKFKYQLDLKPESIDKPVFRYVMDLYEKM